MSYCKGRVIAVHPCSGCWEVVVEGERPGTFAIDNVFVWPIVDTEGVDWIGRQVEYADGMMRFLDTAPTRPDPELASAPCHQIPS